MGLPLFIAPVETDIPSKSAVRRNPLAPSHSRPDSSRNRVSRSSRTTHSRPPRAPAPPTWFIDSPPQSRQSENDRGSWPERNVVFVGRNGPNLLDHYYRARAVRRGRGDDDDRDLQQTSTRNTAQTVAPPRIPASRGITSNLGASERAIRLMLHVRRRTMPRPDDLTPNVIMHFRNAAGRTELEAEELGTEVRHVTWEEHMEQFGHLFERVNEDLEADDRLRERLSSRPSRETRDGSRERQALRSMRSRTSDLSERLPPTLQLISVNTHRLSGLPAQIARVERSARALPPSPPSRMSADREADGLGDRQRSMSPEMWDTLLSTMTPDPEPPSVATSFASGTAVRSQGTSFTTVDAPLNSAEGFLPDPLCDTASEDGSDHEDGQLVGPIVRRRRGARGANTDAEPSPNRQRESQRMWLDALNSSVREAQSGERSTVSGDGVEDTVIHVAPSAHSAEVASESQPRRLRGIGGRDGWVGELSIGVSEDASAQAGPPPPPQQPPSRFARRRQPTTEEIQIRRNEREAVDFHRMIMSQDDVENWRTLQVILRRLAQCGDLPDFDEQLQGRRADEA